MMAAWRVIWRNWMFSTAAPIWSAMAVSNSDAPSKASAASLHKVRLPRLRPWARNGAMATARTPTPNRPSGSPPPALGPPAIQGAPLGKRRLNISRAGASSNGS